MRRHGGARVDQCALPAHGVGMVDHVWSHPAQPMVRARSWPVERPSPRHAKWRHHVFHHSGWPDPMERRSWQLCDARNNL